MAVNIVAMALMPVSQMVSWYLVLYSPLYESVYKIAAFYCAWAIYNRLTTTPQELGFISMGILSISAYKQHRTATLIGNILVLINFAGPAMLILQWSAAKLARKLKKSDDRLAIIWAHIFKLYFVSNILLWGLVLKKFWTGTDETPQDI